MEIIKRTCDPTKYDIYPQYTIMVVGAPEDQYGAVPANKYFIQISDNDSMMWKPMSSLWDDLAYLDNIYDNIEFVQELLAVCLDRKRPYKHLAELLQKISRP